MKHGVLIAALAVSWTLAEAAEAQVVRKRDHRVRDADQDKNEDKEPDRDNTKVKVRRAPPVGVQGFMPATGPVGTKVTIRGTFAKEAKVRIGAKLVEPDRIGARQLVFTVPPGKMGGRKISIEGPNGTVEVGSFDVTAEAGGAPVPPPPVAERPRPARPLPPRVRRSHDRILVSSMNPRTVKVGATVTILGRNFDDSIELSVDGQPVKAQKVGPRAIVFKVPRGAKEESPVVLKHPKVRRPMVVGTLEVGRPDRAAERKKEWEARRKEAEMAWKKRRAELAKDRAERLAAVKAREEELERQRAQRRAAALAAYKKQWKAAFLADEQTQAELALHAERQARLARIVRLAEAADEGGLVVRAQIALEREDRRHERRMAALEAAFKLDGGAQ